MTMRTSNGLELTPAGLEIVIGGVVRSAVVADGTLTITHDITPQESTCEFVLVDKDADIEIAKGDAMSIEHRNFFSGGTGVFKGHVTSVAYASFTSGTRIIMLECDAGRGPKPTTVEAHERERAAAR